MPIYNICIRHQDIDIEQDWESNEVLAFEIAQHLTNQSELIAFEATSKEALAASSRNLVIATLELNEQNKMIWDEEVRPIINAAHSIDFTDHIPRVNSLLNRSLLKIADICDDSVYFSQIYSDIYDDLETYLESYKEDIQHEIYLKLARIYSYQRLEGLNEKILPI